MTQPVHYRVPKPRNGPRTKAAIESLSVGSWLKSVAITVILIGILLFLALGYWLLI